MIINGKEYKNVPITFNTFCKLEEMGVDLKSIENKLFSSARAYAVLCMKKPMAIAGEEIEKHIINGGSINDIIEPFAKELEHSDFFQAMAKQATETSNEAAEE
jgi:hypothetical protein